MAAPREFYVEVLEFPILREEMGNFFQGEIAGVSICVDLHREGGAPQPNQIGIEVSSLEGTIAALQEEVSEFNKVSPGLRRKMGRKQRSRRA